MYLLPSEMSHHFCLHLKAVLSEGPVLIGPSKYNFFKFKVLGFDKELNTLETLKVIGGGVGL